MNRFDKFMDNYSINLAADYSNSKISLMFYNEAVEAGFVNKRDVDRVEKALMYSEDENKGETDRSLSLGYANTIVNKWAHRWAKENKDKGYLQDW